MSLVILIIVSDRLSGVKPLSSLDTSGALDRGSSLVHLSLLGDALAVGSLRNASVGTDRRAFSLCLKVKLVEDSLCHSVSLSVGEDETSEQNGGEQQNDRFDADRKLVVGQYCLRLLSPRRATKRNWKTDHPAMMFANNPCPAQSARLSRPMVNQYDAAQMRTERKAIVIRFRMCRFP